MNTQARPSKRSLTVHGDALLTKLGSRCPWVYYIVKDGSEGGSRGTVFGRVNVDSLTDEGLVKLSPRDERYDLNASPDGQINTRLANADGQATSSTLDEKNGLLIAYSAETLQLVPLQQFKLPDEPFLAADLDRPADLARGVPWTAKIAMLDKRTQVSLADPPAGRTLDGGTLRWTPGSTQVGSARVPLDLASGDVRRRQEFELVVRRPAVDLPFSPAVLRLSPDGKMALIADLGEEGQFQRPQRARGSSARLALIDLTSRKLIADRSLDQPLSDVALDANGVYIAPRGSPAFLVLSPKDLSDKQRVFTDQPVARFTLAGNRVFNLGADSNRPDQTVAYVEPALTPVRADLTFSNFGETTRVKSTSYCRSKAAVQPSPQRTNSRACARNQKSSEYSNKNLQ